MVQVKRQDRRKVYEYLLLEGVIVIKKVKNMLYPGYGSPITC